MKKLSEELAELDLVFQEGKETEVDRERFNELMGLLDSAPELLEALKEWHNIYEWGLKTGAIKIQDIKRFSNKCTGLIEKAEGRAV